MTQSPSLFGIKNSNRDFLNPETWGKNQFNSSFPASLVCYFQSKNLNCNYINVNKGALQIGNISPTELFNIDPLSSDTLFSFESQFLPFQKFVYGNLPRVDLVIQSLKTGTPLRGLEIKLTALPDNTTCDLSDEKYGSEIVVRPDSIVYLATSLAFEGLKEISDELKKSKINIKDWTNAEEVIPHTREIMKSLLSISIKLEKKQQPFLLQPIWKTLGKSSKLAENCLDIFVWSDTAFCQFITRISKLDSTPQSINRQTRTVVWLYKMFYDLVYNGKFNHSSIIDSMSYNTKNDKAFASSGNITNSYMTSEFLTKPRISKSEIKKIILGGGQNLLSPERRFDAIISNSPELFS